MIVFQTIDAVAITAGRSNNMNTGIYYIINLANNKKYIGSSFNIKQRIKKHFNQLACNKHINKHLQYAYNLYGKDNFSFIIVEIINDIISDKELRDLEQKHINMFKSNELYNQCLTAGSTKGKRHSQETKNKISLANKGMKSKRVGIPLSESHKLKLSEAHKNQPNKNKGKPNFNRMKPVCKIDIQTGKVLEQFGSAKEASIITHIHYTDISKCCNNRLKQAGGYFWRFV